MTARSMTFALLLLAGATGSASLQAQGRAGTVEVDGVTLQYRIDGSGKPLVLVNGGGLNLHEWDNIVEDLARHYEVIRYDPRGSGTSGGRSDPTADAADLKGLLEALGVSRAYVLGHSAGGRVALTLAVRYPEMADGLILFGSAHPVGFGQQWDGPDAPPRTAAAGIQSLDSLRAARFRWMQHAMFHDRPIPPAILARIQVATRTNHGDELFEPPAPHSNLAPPIRMDELRKVKAPTLVLIGDEEMPYGQLVARDLAYGITGAQMVVVPGGGHALSLQEPERFTAEVLRFLRLAEEGKAAGS